MRIIVAGGSGFLGGALTTYLMSQKHDVVVLTRGASRAASGNSPTFATWTPNGQVGAWATVFDGADGVVNLSGESIAGKRWSQAQKGRILESRMAATRSLTSAIRAAARPPAVMVSGSAVGYYGDRGEETLTESSAPGSDFLAGVCKQWEAAASEVANLTRVALIRTGIVLDRRGGALPKMLPPFLMFAGGPLGSGKQYMPWIHKDDWVSLVAWILTSESVRGPVNLTGPRPVTNGELSRALGRTLRRPSLLPAPAFALRLALGEMADALLLSGQRALPVRATDLGFVFRYSSVDDALAAVFNAS